MAHFAKINKNNIVEEIICIENEVLNEPEFSFPETETVGKLFISKTLKLDGEWKQTSYNSSFRKNYAGIGFIYDQQKDAFIPPQPYNSWTLNENEYSWEPPIPYPQDDLVYNWDEYSQKWVLLSDQ